MLDFNKRKKILRKLSDTAEKNVLLLIPCLIAAGFVKLFYFIVCNLDIALSDKDGNFLGIKRERPEKQSRRKKDDIVYVKRGFVPRMMSLVLSFAFVMMFVPTVLPSIQTFAAGWTSRGVEDSIFVVVDNDDRYIFDINVPFDDFKAPIIEGISKVRSDSCSITWNKEGYISGTRGDALPSKFWPAKTAALYEDGVITSIEVWAYVTKNGQTYIEQCDTSNWAYGLIINGGKLSNLPSEINVINLDPDAEYKFYLKAIQQWTGCNADKFVPEYTLDADNYVTNNTNQLTVTYPERCEQYIDDNGDVVDDDPAVLVYQSSAANNGGAAAGRYLPGSYAEDAANGNKLKYTPITDKKALGAGGKIKKIPYFSNYATLPARRLANVSTKATYDADANTVQVKLGSTPPVETKGYLVFRSAVNGDDSSFKIVAKVPKTDENSAPDRIVYNDSDIQPTTQYKYYICPVSWKDDVTNINGNPLSLNDYNDTDKNKFITAHLPGIYVDESSYGIVYTDTAVPKNFSISQSGTSFILSWDRVKNATSYIISRSFRYDPDSYQSDIKELVRISADSIPDGENTFTFQDDKIAYDTDYTYYLVAVNSSNNNNTSTPAATVTGRLSTVDLSSPWQIQIEAGDDFAEITWRCDDQKVDGFDIQYIRSDRLAEATKNVTKNAIAQIRTNHPEETWTGNDTTDEVKIKENFAIEFEDAYNTLYDEAFTESANKVSRKRDEVAVEGSTNLFSYTAYNLTPEAKYAFRVRSYIMTVDPYDPNSVVKRPASLYFDYPKGYEATIKTAFDPPNNVKAVSENGDITVTWDPVKSATGYEIEIRRYDKNSKFISKTTENITGTKYELKGLRAGDLYVFTVKGTKRISGLDEPKKTDASNPAYAVVGDPIKKVTDLTAVQEKNAVKVSWTAATGEFSGYYLYITNNGKTIRKDITSSEYLHTDVQFGQTYSYYVTTYRTVMLSDGTYQYFEGDPSNTETVTIGGTIGFPTDLVPTPSEKEIKLEWKEVTGADGYIVYATCDGKTESFNVTSAKFTHTGLTPGKKYSYYVVAYKTVNNVPVTSAPSVTVSAVVGGAIAAPVDFAVTTNETSAILSWTTVQGATGYTVYGVSDTGKKLEIDVSKTPYTHTGLTEGETWSYYVKAYKLDNNEKLYSEKTNTITVKIGASYPPPNDLVATPGNRTVALKWTTNKGVDGYIVYVYDENTGDFQPLSIVSKGTYDHTGLKNGKKYTYMVAAYKFVNGVRVIGDYSLAVSAIPTSGNAADVDYTINIKGTAPYGISHSELISAAANHEAFDDPVDAYFSVNDESTRAVKEVLRGYANGLKSFIVYPFDISLYLENTLVEVEPNDGFNITFTVPVPDVMKDYRDYITVVHLKDDGTETIEDTVSDNIFVQSTDLEVLPSAIVDVGGVWCVQFTTASCSPFAFVIYKDNLDDVSSGSAASGSGGYSGSFNTGVLLITVIPDILPIEKKTKFVERTKKRYRIKK